MCNKHTMTVQLLIGIGARRNIHNAREEMETAIEDIAHKYRLTIHGSFTEGISQQIPSASPYFLNEAIHDAGFALSDKPNEVITTVQFMLNCKHNHMSFEGGRLICVECGTDNTPAPWLHLEDIPEDK